MGGMEMSQKLLLERFEVFNFKYVNNFKKLFNFLQSIFYYIKLLVFTNKLLN